MPDEPEDQSSSRQSPGHLDALFRLLNEQEAHLCAPSNEEGFSIGEGFSAEESTPEKSLEREEAIQRVVVRSEKEAAGGQVTAVQAALRNGWQLVDIALREESAEEGRSLAFTLRREDCGPRAPAR
jgi:nitrogen fixation protein